MTSTYFNLYNSFQSALLRFILEESGSFLGCDAVSCDQECHQAQQGPWDTLRTKQKKVTAPIQAVAYTM